MRAQWVCSRQQRISNHQSIIKIAADELVPIFQLSHDTGEVPEDGKNAWIVLILKKGETPGCKLLKSIPCKILEHTDIVHNLNSNLKTLFYKDCSLGSVKNLSTVATVSWGTLTNTASCVTTNMASATNILVRHNLSPFTRSQIILPVETKLSSSFGLQQGFQQGTPLPSATQAGLLWYNFKEQQPHLDKSRRYYWN